jgi:iron complex transport system substrate-binding protein
MDLSGRTVAFWFADTKTPYVGGGRGSTQLLASMTGMTNVYADRVEDWPPSAGNARRGSAQRVGRG